MSKENLSNKWPCPAHPAPARLPTKTRAGENGMPIDTGVPPAKWPSGFVLVDCEEGRHLGTAVKPWAALTDCLFSDFLETLLFSLFSLLQMHFHGKRQ